MDYLEVLCSVFSYEDIATELEKLGHSMLEFVAIYGLQIDYDGESFLDFLGY